MTLAASPASPAQAALGGVTPFEIDSNTTVTTVGGTDWVSKFATGDVAVSNDQNFTGDPVVQTDVGSSSTAPSWLPNCPSSNSDTVFKNSTNIADPDWTGDQETQSVTNKADICQSYFAVDVVTSGARVGHIISYVAFTRRVFNGDGSYYFLLSKGPNPDVRVAGDIVIEVDYDSQGAAQGLRTATWGGTPLALGAPTNVGINNANVQLSPVQYFAEVALDLTALGLAPNVFDLPTPASCQAFGFGRVISRTGNSASATLKDDGEPSGLDFNVCGALVIKKQLTAAVPGSSDFPVTVTPPSGVTLPFPSPVLRVPGGTTTGGTPVDGNANPAPNATPTGNPVNYNNLPPRQGDGYNVWEPLAGQLGVRWDLVSIVCVNDKGTAATGDDVTTTIDDPSDEFGLLTLETVTCTIINSPAPAIINVDKLASGQPGSWPVTLSGAGSGSVNVSDDGTNNFTTAGTFQTFGNRAAGSYTLTEGAEAGGAAFRPSGWSCQVVGGGAPTTASGASIGINANPGDVINCTITNAPVAPPNVEVTKSAAPTSFPETATAPGSPVVYTVDVKNAGAEPFKITNLTDALQGGSTFDLDAAVAGNNAGLTGATIVANNCGALINQTVAGGATATCQFSVSYTGRNAGDVIKDNVTGFVVDDFGRTDSDDDDATVNVTDVPPVITVDKQNVEVNNTTAVVAPGGLAVYSIKITNGPNAIEPITLTAVTDTLSTSGGGFVPTGINYFTVGGPVTATTCSNYVGTVLQIGAFVTCQFTIDTTKVGPLAENDVLTNRIDVTAVDDDATPVSGFDTASRTVLGEPPALGVFKTDNGALIDEPGEDIAYDLTLTNLSITEPLTITSIVDEVFFTPLGGVQTSIGSIVIDVNGVDDGGLTGATLVSTNCDGLIDTVLAVNGDEGDQASCTITLHLEGNAGDSYHDIVTTVAVDDEGTPAQAQNEADTPVVDVLPLVEILKDVTPGELPETGGQVMYTLTVTNNSVTTDPLTITDLSDSVFGSFFPDDTTTGIDSTDCFDLEGVVLASGEDVSCTITATISGEANTSHDNIASVTGEDDEGNPASDNDPASVDFTDVLPKIIVTKSASPTTVPESGGLVTFTVTVENDTLEPVMTTDLVDAINGGSDIDLVGLVGSTCVAGVTLAADDNVAGSGLDFYSCTFTRTVAQVGNELSENDVVTVTAEDNEENQAIDDDDATVGFELIPPTVTINKTDLDATVNEPGGNVTYHLTIANTSSEAVTITTLTDTITYANPPLVVGPFSVLATGPQVLSTTCVAGTALAANDGVPGSGPDQTTCQFTVALSGTAQIVSDVVNVVVVDNDNQSGTDGDDELTPILDIAPEVHIVKDANPTSINVGDTVTYTLTISNVKDVEPITLLTLVDDKFGDIFDECVTNGMATELAPNDGAPGGDDETTCVFTRELNESPGTTHVNTVTVTAADDEILNNPEGVPVSDSDDASVLTLAPSTSVVKTVTGSATVDAAGLWTIAYDVAVTNAGPGRGIVDIDDTLKFGTGVVVQSVTVTGPVGVTLNPAFDGAADPVIANDAVIAAGTTQHYTVTVTARIDNPILGEGAGVCDPQEAEAGGFLNTVTVTSTTTDEVDSDSACAPFSTLTLVKNLSNDNGGNATLADFLLTASANGITHVSGTGTVTEAVPAGTYSLAETPKAGYTASANGFVCTTEQTGSSVTVPAGAEVTCTITNDDEAVDLTLTKSDGNVSRASGDQTPFPYTITVQNLGPRETDNEPVTVVDDLPDAFEWVAPAPAGCTINGQKLTCDVAPPSLRPVGNIVTITATARLKAGSTAGTFDNRAYVTTQDDSVTTPPPCTDAAAVAADNNVDCESTPVTPVADMAIVKTASVPQVGAGGGFTWLLDVTNNGPDPATNVSISDIVPGQVTVTGVTSAQFNCTNSGNTVSCTKAGMAVGEKGSISIAVTVPTAAAGGDVTNVGSVTASQPDPVPTNNSDDASVTIVAQAPPPPTPPPVILPPTGSNSTTPVTWAAISLVLMGGAVLLVSRRRRDHSSID
jgi:uncharacterized repeat protein (TIGR01451 family)/LPXTG-motif cell wall-anchored protein